MICNKLELELEFVFDGSSTCFLYWSVVFWWIYLFKIIIWISLACSLQASNCMVGMCYLYLETKLQIHYAFIFRHYVLRDHEPVLLVIHATCWWGPKRLKWLLVKSSRGSPSGNSPGILLHRNWCLRKGTCCILVEHHYKHLSFMLPTSIPKR